MKVAMIVSGGQTGADRAALDVAAELALPYSGWCPKGGWAEDLAESPGLLATYPCLRETPGADVSTRTAWNVRDSHATLVVSLHHGSPSTGTALTIATAARLGRPLLQVDVGQIATAASWLGSLGEELTLNVAGPRESEAPGLYAAAQPALRELLRQVNRAS